MFVQALGLQSARLIAICGGGGKTSLMFTLAQEFVDQGERVLLTTTTKIAASEGRKVWPLIMAVDAQTLLAAARQGHAGQSPAVMAAFGENHDTDKLLGFAPEIIDELFKDSYFDRIIVEADGALRKPLKAPAPYEPVIPSTSDSVIMVAGINGLGKPLNAENLFRPHIWQALTGDIAEQPITPESLAKVAIHKQGLGKGATPHMQKVLYLNQVDTPERLDLARRVIREINATTGHGIDVIASGVLRPEPKIIDQSASQE